MLKCHFDYLLIIYNLDNYILLGDIFNTVIIWVAAHMLQKFQARLVLNLCVSGRSVIALNRSNVNSMLLTADTYLNSLDLCVTSLLQRYSFSTSLMFIHIIFWGSSTLLHLGNPFDSGKQEYKLERKTNAWYSHVWWYQPSDSHKELQSSCTLVCCPLSPPQIHPTLVHTATQS